MPTSLKYKSGGGSAMIGEIVELNPAFPPIVEIEGKKFLKYGYSVSDGYSTELEKYKSVVNGFTEISNTGIIKGFAEDGGVIVAVGTSSLIRRSLDDGLTWTTITSPITANFTGVKAFNGVIIAIGNTNQVIRSTDHGLTWTAVTVAAAANNLAAIETDGVNWVVSRDTSPSNIYHSADKGLTWTEVITDRVSIENPVKSIAYSNGVFVAVMTSRTEILFSVNGGTRWVSQDTGTGTLLRVVATDGVFIFGGASSGTNKVSLDGLNTFTNIASYNKVFDGMAISDGKLYYNAGGGNLGQAKLSAVVSGDSSMETLYQPLSQFIDDIHSVNGKIFVTYTSYNNILRSNNSVGISQVEIQGSATTGQTRELNSKLYMRIL